ncbi:radical SAM family heme chaperone HemW [Puniceicoccaceae bacterium K14]|nr:radical SAM family heme chaperone HemW [Puniceicoccaceae bacterium K14]
MEKFDKMAKLRGDSLGIYLHVPFCSTTCDFCAFYQEAPRRQGIVEYLDGIDRELSLIEAPEKKVDTCFWGGGTPGLLPAGDLDRLCKAVVSKFGQPQHEWTVEMAPSSVRKDKLQALKDNGVTRISMGVQSWDDGLLESLGRLHTSKLARKALDLVQEVGFESINLDLIFAIPGQTAEQWRSDLSKTLSLGIDHISTYCLTFEEDTALYVKLSEGKVSIDTEKETAFYRVSWEETERAGFEQYEISNYAKKGHECLHNLNTWRMDEWIGVGPSAASQSELKRYSNPADLKNWLGDLKEGRRGLASEPEVLDAGILFEDCLIFGLRMNEGVNLDTLKNRFGRDLPESVKDSMEQLEGEGKLVKEGGKLRLTGEGRLVADAIGTELLGRFSD